MNNELSFSIGSFHRNCTKNI